MAYLNIGQQQYYDNELEYGNYQFTTIRNIVDQFMVAYVGEDKIINKVRRTDVVFHAMRGIQEFSFDVFKSCKSLEVEIGNTLIEPLPQDYVNYTKISWVDSAGIKHPLYPTLSNTSNPRPAFLKNENDDYALEAVGTLVETSSEIELDKEYLNIKVGMVVSGPSIPADTFVISATNLANKTTIRMSDTINPLTSTGVFPTTSGPEKLKFTNAGGSLVKQLESSVKLESNTFDANSNKINLNSVEDANLLEIGMFVSSICFPPGTEIIDIQAETVTTSTNSVLASTSESEIVFTLTKQDSVAWTNYKTHVPAENTNDDYEVDEDIYDLNIGQRYGLDPYHAQVNGSYYIDCDKGKIHFSSNVAGKTVIIDYISDGLGTDKEMKVHKFAEEAMYKWILHAVLSTKANTPEYIVARFKKERFAAVRQAKLRLSSIKLEELTQILRGKSKWIKH